MNSVLEEVDVEEQLEQQEGQDSPVIKINTETNNVEEEKSNTPDEEDVDGEDNSIPVDPTSTLFSPENTFQLSTEQKNVAQPGLDEPNLDEISDNEDSGDESDDGEEFKKLDNDISRDYLLSYHPELKQINYTELLSLSKITRNKNGVIIDPLHKTFPYLTKFERAKILGQRAKQINNGSTIFVKVTPNIIDGHTIALMELNQKKIPFIIKRPLPNGVSEYWKVSDLNMLD